MSKKSLPVAYSKIRHHADPCQLLPCSVIDFLQYNPSLHGVLQEINTVHLLPMVLQRPRLRYVMDSRRTDVLLRSYESDVVTNRYILTKDRAI